MVLTYSGYAHITAHTVQVIDQFKEDLRVKLVQDPSQASFWREHYLACAFGAQSVWISAAAGLTNPEDAITIAQKVHSLSDK